MSASLDAQKSAQQKSAYASVPKRHSYFAKISSDLKR